MTIGVKIEARTSEPWILSRNLVTSDINEGKEETYKSACNCWEDLNVVCERDGNESFTVVHELEVYCDC